MTADELIDGKYRLVRTIGRGGMGTVYEGLNVRIGRRVAIKVLHGRAAEDSDLVKRFEMEAQAATRAGSRHIVEVLDLGELPEGDCFMVMEYLEGETLGVRIKRLGALSPGEIVPLAIELCDGLHAAHTAGIVHRDLKPDNVFVAKVAGGGETVKIVDFGVSKFRGISDTTRATDTGTLLGTPRYMAPEQIKDSRRVDGRADLFAVGTILYRALAGTHAFQAENYHELMYKIANEDAAPLEGVDGDLAAIVSRALARDRDARFQSAAELGEALRRWLAGAPGEELASRRPARSEESISEPTLSTTVSARLTARSLAEPRSRSALWLLALAVAAGGALAWWRLAPRDTPSPAAPSAPVALEEPPPATIDSAAPEPAAPAAEPSVSSSVAPVRPTWRPTPAPPPATTGTGRAYRKTL